MPVSTVELELREATGDTPRAKEPRTDFLIRLAKDIGRLSDPKWDKLSARAQSWWYSASRALKEDPDRIRDFDGSRAPVERVTAPVVDGSAGMTGIKTDIKRLLLANPRISTEDIMTELKKKGDTPSPFTVASIRADFRHSLKFLKAKGMIKIDV